MHGDLGKSTAEVNPAEDNKILIDIIGGNPELIVTLTLDMMGVKRRVRSERDHY